METKEILQEIEEINPDAAYPTGFEEAILGYVDRFGMDSQCLIDYNKCLLILQERDAMTEEEAVEYMEFNVVQAWVGDGTPLFARILR